MSVLAVVGTHATAHWWYSAWWGPLARELGEAVDVFFVLSGFLLYRPFVAARAAGKPPPRVRDYARRRILRIVPGYWVALTALGLTFGLPGVFGVRSWVYYGFLQSYQYQPRGGLGPAWTLSVEASFYVLLPLFALLVRYLGGAGRAWVRHEAVLLGTVGMGCLALRTGAFYKIVPVPPSSILCQADFLALGMGLAVISVCGSGWRRVSSLGTAGLTCLSWGLAAGCFAVLALKLPMPDAAATSVSPVELFWHHVLALVGTGCVVAPAVFDRLGARFPARVLRVRVVAWVGVISYGIYLWHGPLLTWLAPIVGSHPHDWLLGSAPLSAVLVTLAVSIPMAAASYYLVELPFLRRKAAPLGSPLPVGTTGISAPLSAAAAELR